MSRAREMYRHFALHEGLIDDRLRSDIVAFASLPRLYLFTHRLEVPLHPMTLTETQSINENDFECLASTGVDTTGTMFPNWGPRYSAQPRLGFLLILIC